MSSATNPVGVNIPELLNPATPLATNQIARSNYLAWRTTMADALTTLRAAGAVVLFRPCSEVNGAWFWWGNRPRDQYLALWRDLHDHFTFTRGLTNLLWVYEPDQTVHLVPGATTSGTPIDYYYPGDDVTDVVGHNCYDDDWALPYDSDAVWRNYEKPFAVPQAGPSAQRDGTFDNFTYLNGVTNTLPRLSFFCVWNSFTTGGGAVTNNIAITDNLNASNFLAHPLLVTRSKAPTCKTGPTDPPPRAPTCTTRRPCPSPSGDSGNETARIASSPCDHPRIDLARLRQRVPRQRRARAAG
jgi:hypothetical protein